MTTTNVSKITPNKSTTPKNGTTSEDHSEQPAAATSPTAPSVVTATAPEKKPVTVMIPETLHRKVKVLAELAGVSLSDLVEEQLRAIVRDRLPGLLSKLDAES